MVLTIVISMLIVMSCHTIIVVCSKKGKKTLEAKQSVENNAVTGGCTPATPAKSVRPATVNSVVDREDRESTRTKVGKKKKSSDEQDSTDDAFADLAARLKNKNAEKTGDNSLFGDDDENPMAQFQMPERPVVDPKVDGAKLQQMVELEKKPLSPAPASKQRPAKSMMPATAGPMTAKEVSLKNASKKRKASKNRGVSKRDETVGTDRTQSAERDKRGSEDVENTQDSGDDESEVKENKTQRLSLMNSTSNRAQKSNQKSTVAQN